MGRFENNIHLVIAGPDYGALSSPSTFQIIQGVSRALKDNGFHLIIDILEPHEEYEGIIEIMNLDLTKGVLLWGTRMKDELFVNLIKSDKPCVSISRFVKGARIHHVTEDDLYGGYIATKHLIDLGHDKIAYIGKMDTVSTARNRHIGYRQALMEAGIPYDDMLVFDGDFYEKSGAKAMEKIIDEYGRQITGVFAASDLMAIGAVRTCADRGIIVPEDISIIGFDNLAMTDLMKVGLTTIDIPALELGYESAVKLIHLLEGKTVNLKDLVNVELIVRQSTSSRKELYRS